MYILRVCENLEQSCGYFTDQIKFLSKIKSSQALEKYQVTVWPLEAAVSIWVENLPLTVDEGIKAVKQLFVYLIFFLLFCSEQKFCVFVPVFK